MKGTINRNENIRFVLQGRWGGFGYSLAGFEVVGVDIVQQPHYPFTFVQMDALEFLRTQDLSEFDAIHASPPCQRYSRCKALAEARNRGHYGEHPDMIPITREYLQKTGKPYVIENVVGADLKNPISLSGTQFDYLYTQRK